MRYTQKELEVMAKPFFRVTSSIYGCTDGHFFYSAHEARTHAEKNRCEFYEIKKTTKKAD